MRVLLVNKVYGFEGGVEQYLHWIARELTDQGMEVWFLCAERDKAASYIPEERVLLIPELLRESLDPDPETEGRLKRSIEKVAPDLIYLHHLRNPNWIAPMQEIAPIIRFAHMEDVVCPLIEKSFVKTWEPCNYRSGTLTCGILCPYVHRHGSRHPRHIRERLRYRERLQSENGKIRNWVVASRFMKASLVREGYPEASVHLNPYFIFPPAEIVAPPADSRKVLFSGRLVESKGVDYLLRAFALLSPDTELGIVGNGPDRERLEALATQLGVADRVCFHGRLPNESIGKLREAARLIAVPSLFQEPFGIVGIEAMAFGRPVVAHKVGGIPDWLEHGRNGFLVEGKDIKDFARRMGALMDDRQLATAYGEAGREMVMERYVPKAHMSRLLEVLNLGR